MINLNSDIKYIKGVGEKRAELFNKLGISCVKELVNVLIRKDNSCICPGTRIVFNLSRKKCFISPIIK